MGFLDLLTDAGLTSLNSWLTTRSYIVGHTPSQADVTTFKAVTKAPDAGKYPHAARWYKHIATYESEFATLPGDASKEYSVYGPEASELTVNPAQAAEGGDDDDDVDLFGSDEEEDPEAARIREERLAEYRKKKEAKPKVAAKSIATIEIKAWEQSTDLDDLMRRIKEKINPDGLVWSQHKLVPVVAGMNKIQVNMTVEDDKVSPSDIQEQIEEEDDFGGGEDEEDEKVREEAEQKALAEADVFGRWVQSTDMIAMQKL